MNLDLLLRFCRKLRKCDAGEVVITEGDLTGRMYVLFEGSAEILKDGVAVGTASEPGVVFGEMSALLGIPHTATVRTLAPTTFCVIEDARSTITGHPDLGLHIAELLARRVDAVNRFLVDARRQLEGHEHADLIDQALELLVRDTREKSSPAKGA